MESKCNTNRPAPAMAQGITWRLTMYIYTLHTKILTPCDGILEPVVIEIKIASRQKADNIIQAKSLINYATKKIQAAHPGAEMSGQWAMESQQVKTH